MTASASVGCGCGVGSLAGGKGTEVGPGPGVCSAVVGRSAGCEVGALEGTGVGCTVVGAGDGERDGSGVNSCTCMIVKATAFISTTWRYPPLSTGSTVAEPLASTIREPVKSEKKSSFRETLIMRKVAGAGDMVMAFSGWPS